MGLGQCRGPQPDACPGAAGNSTIDRYGCVDDDGDGMSNESDAFPNDPTRTQDSDGDGFDDLEDDCIYLAGNSTADRKACPDTDGDGYSDPTLPLNGQTGWNASDGADALPLEPTQWADQDGDGYGDNQSGFQPDSCPTVEGYSNIDIFGCYDEDNDGSSQTGDAFPDDPTQWSDIDGDGFGDNPNGTQPDNCTTQIGTSTLDVFGCPDEDGDGASDTNDLWLNDSSQWFDSDGDGFGDNVAGTDGDACPQEFGLSSLGNNIGCVDSDGDKTPITKMISLTRRPSGLMLMAMVMETTTPQVLFGRTIGPMTLHVMLLKDTSRALRTNSNWT